MRDETPYVMSQVGIHYMLCMGPRRTAKYRQAYMAPEYREWIEGDPDPTLRARTPQSDPSTDRPI